MFSSRYVHRFLFLLCFLDLVLCQQLPQNQTNTMIRLYQLIQNDTGSSFPWRNVRNDSNPCSWRQVSCSRDNSSIVKLSLSEFWVSSPDILPLLCQIDTLESLDLSSNSFSLIPDEFISSCGGISGLRLLNLTRNRFSGSFPSFNGFGMLEHLDLSHNSWRGNISLELSGLGSLKSLNLSYNNFTGPVPTNLGVSSMLEELQLSCNHFNGEIPAEWRMRYGNLSSIDLSVNNLSGSIPDWIGEFPRLQFLLLSANNLRGGIPSSISNVQTLLRFAANQNNFSGNLPAGLTRYLKNIDLSYNRLNGMMPQDLLSQPNLQAVDLSFNKLQGSLPANISSSLVRLRLGANLLNGSLPSVSFRNSLNLTYLELDNNDFSGPIPKELGFCQKLALLNVAHNRLSGDLPAELGNLTNLQGLYLQQNNLIGVIPSYFTHLQRLQRLNLSSNSINGSIPETITMLSNLTNLDLGGNQLSGSIPNSIYSLNLLLELQLGNNKLSGNIPTLPTSLQIALNLSSNLFQGQIPATLSRLTALEVLDLSNNQFSGQIPQFLTTMGGLTHLILSNNQLSGFIPKFGSFVTIAIGGNKDLRNATDSTPASSKRRKTVSVGIILAVAVAASIVAAVIAIIVVSLSRRLYRINDVHLQSEEDLLPQQHVILGNLLTANGIHRSNIDFGKAMESVRDTSNVILKTKFSTYYKAVMPSGVSYLVKKLNWTDKIFQLGNHDKFGEELEVLGRLSNSNVMIPLAYVLTVDSAYLFYEFAAKGTLFDVLHGKKENTLNWASRYSIAIGVAQGLAFLHGRPSGSILLLDLCSKSIMLKSINEPQVGDIELCKVIDPSKSTASLSTVAGSVGYIPPEYAYTMRVTTAGNVYSFGVILLELVTGKPRQGTELAKWVLSNSAQQSKWDHILDSSVSSSSLAVRSQMVAVLKVAIACVSVSPDARPNMKSVLRMLLNAR